MTQRLHPEDLRALIAGIHQAHDSLDPIGSTDALLAELAKTAKPEPPLTIEEVTEGRTVTVYPCPRCGETDPTSVDWWRGVVQEMEQQASELRNKFAAATAQLETAEARVKELEAEVQRIRAAPWGVWTRAQLSAEVDRLNTALQTVRTNAVREERERIIRLFGPEEDGGIPLLAAVHGAEEIGQDTLRVFLEPKP